MEMPRRGADKQFFADAGDGAMANLHRELLEMKRSAKRCQRILAGLLVVFGIVLLALVVVVAIDSRRIHSLRQRQGLLKNPNVTFASYSGDQSVNGLTYGGSLFRGSGFWSSKPPLRGGNLTDHAAIAVGEQVYIIGGADETGIATNRVWLYDSIFLNYTEKSHMPDIRYRFGAALDNTTNKIYVVGGRTIDNVVAGCANTTFIYDIASDKWSIGSDVLAAGSDQCAVYLDGKVYMTGGISPDYAYLNALQIYDIATDSWTYGNDMPTKRADLMCASFDGEMYAVGGYVNNGSDQNSFTVAVESYNPSTAIWTTQPPLLTPRGDGAITVLPGDKLMVVGGEGHYDNVSDWKYPKHTNEIYYGADKTWVEKAMIPTARFRTAAATAGGLAYVFGGANVCIGVITCPAQDVAEVYLDVDHPHVYIYLKDEAYNDNAALTTYPV